MTVHELAAEMSQCSLGNCSPKTVYGYLEDDGREIPLPRLLAVAHYIERTFGRTDIADCFHTPEFMSVRREGSSTNGRIEDEMADMTEVMTDLRRAHRSGDRAEFRRAFQRGGAVWLNVDAEGRLLD